MTTALDYCPSEPFTRHISRLLDPPHIGGLTLGVGELVDELQSETGRALVQESSTTSPLFSRWLEVALPLANKGTTQAAEELFDDVDEGRLTTGDNDAAFLRTVAGQSSLVEAITAIRLLGMLGEEGYLSQSFVAGILEDLLCHRDPQRRYYAVRALWQARISTAVPTLKRRLEQEASGEVRKMIDRAVAVLE